MIGQIIIIQDLFIINQNVIGQISFFFIFLLVRYHFFIYILFFFRDFFYIYSSISCIDHSSKMAMLAKKLSCLRMICGATLYAQKSHVCMIDRKVLILTKLLR